jgi:hypothetical protein
MGREGTIDLVRIEKLLADGGPLKTIAAKFEVSWCALRRHWLGLSADRKNYLKFGAQMTRSALAAAVDEEKLATLDHFRLVRAGLHRSFARAVEIGDLNAVAALGKALDHNIERTARLAGEWRDEPKNITNIAVLNLPGVAGVISGIARALVDFPEARRRVVEFLKSTDGVTAADTLPAPEVVDVAAE